MENDGYGAHVNLYGGFYYIPCNSITFEKTVPTTVVVQYTMWMTDYTDYADLSMCFYGIHYTDWQRPNCCGVHICDNCMLSPLSWSLDPAIYWWEWPRNSRFTEWAILKLKLLTLQWSICTIRKISWMTRITAFNQQTATLWLNCVSIVMRIHQLANVKKTCCYCFFPPVFNIVSTCV